MFQRFWVLLRRRTNEQGKSKQKKLAGCPEGSQRHGFQDAVSAAENLLSLYNAVNRTSYTDADALTVVTLENAIYMNMKNDTAFILDDRLSLYEHQSTWNPNMPLRNLFYVSRTYQGFMKDESVYSDRKIQIPTPHFIVFYNGMERIPERVVLKLSDSFEKNDGKPELELVVTVLNINQGNNKEIMELC